MPAPSPTGRKAGHLHRPGAGTYFLRVRIEGGAMVQPYTYRVGIDTLILEIGQALADKNQSEWAKPEWDNDLRRSVASAINVHGLPSAAIPGLLPHVERAIVAGEISPRSTFNDIPAIDMRAVMENRQDWYLTPRDADTVRHMFGLHSKYLAPDDSIVISPAPTVPIPAGRRLLNVEDMLEAITQAKYGPCPAPDDENYNLHVESDKMLKREAIRTAFRDGMLTARLKDGSKYASPPAGEFMDKVYIERSQFAKFAADEWLMPIVECDLEQGLSMSPTEGKSLRPNQRSYVQASITHTLGTRRHALDHIINMAKAASSAPESYLSVWPEMVRIAQAGDPPAPIMGYVEGDGIKYAGNNDAVKFFNKDALRKMMKRTANKAR